MKGLAWMSVTRRYCSHSAWRRNRRISGQKKNEYLIQRNRKKKILVILHLYYPNSWIEIREYLYNMQPYYWDLIVTIPDSVYTSILDETIKSDFPTAKVLICPNRGFDVAPFLAALKSIPDISVYDVIFKLQSKGIKRRAIYIYNQLFIGRDWMLDLFEGIMGPNTIHQSIDAIVNDNAVGIVCAGNLIVEDPLHKKHITEQILSKYNLEYIDEYKFVAGTCFAMKPSIAKEIAALSFNISDFESEQEPGTLSLAHVLERYFGMINLRQGLLFRGFPVRRFTKSLKRPLEHVLYSLSSERLFDLPYLYDDEYFMWQLDNKLIKWNIVETEVGKLCYQPNIHSKAIPLAECYPYKFLTGDVSSYQEYCNKNSVRNPNAPHMSTERYTSLIDSIDTQGYDQRHIIIVNTLGAITDGQHRACVIAYKKGLNYKIKVLELTVINSHGLLKILLPKCLLKYYIQQVQKKKQKKLM